MSFWFSLPSITSLREGEKYRIWFNVNDDRIFPVIPDINTPTNYVIPFNETFQLRIFRTEKFLKDHKVAISGEVIKIDYVPQNYSPMRVRTPQVVPVIVIVAGIIAVLGLTALYLTFDKVEKLIESPVIETTVVVGLIVVVFIMIIAVKKYSTR